MLPVAKQEKIIVCKLMGNKQDHLKVLFRSSHWICNVDKIAQEKSVVEKSWNSWP